jgi:hypothetical protein
MTGWLMLRAQRNANPSASTRHTIAPTRSGSDLRTLRANVYRLTRMATPPSFNEHGPRDTRSRILSAFPLVVYDPHPFT